MDMAAICHCLLLNRTRSDLQAPSWTRTDGLRLSGCKSWHFMGPLSAQVKQRAADVNTRGGCWWSGLSALWRSVARFTGALLPRPGRWIWLHPEHAPGCCARPRTHLYCRTKNLEQMRFVFLALILSNMLQFQEEKCHPEVKAPRVHGEQLRARTELNEGQHCLPLTAAGTSCAAEGLNFHRAQTPQESSSTQSSTRKSKKITADFYFIYVKQQECI